MTRSLVTADDVRAAFDYDPSTGCLTWRVALSSRAKVGEEAGSIYGSTGYRYVGIGGRYYLVHRVIWLWVYGVWPSHTVDHIDCNRLNNRVANLRDIPQVENAQNRRRADSDSVHSKYLGVTREGGRWKAQISNNGKSIYIGRFDSEVDAHEAFLAQKRLLHKGCTI